MTTSGAGGQPLHILLVEDDDVDVMAVRRAFHQQRIGNPIHVAADGEEALALLRVEGADALPRPVVLMVDLNMPRMNGLELIRTIRADEALKKLPVYVLTTSGKVSHREAADALGVVGYGIKADVARDFEQVLRKLGLGVRLVSFS
ncbi:MAG: CheY-like chemotaxis protein [Myxococcota bacterium]|jgi:CheY-like chemotaxis protein